MDRLDFKSDSWFKQVFTSAPDPAWIIAGNRFIECNEAAVRTLGYKSREELLNVHPSKLSPPTQADGQDSFAKAELMMSLAMANGLHRFEWIHNKADGTSFDAEVTLTRISLDDQDLIYCTWRDITKRKLREAQTLELLTLNETILNNALVGIAYLKHRHIVSCNRRLEEIFHYASGELIGASVRLLYDSQETFEHIGRVAYAAVTDNKNFSTEVKLRHKDGSVFWGALSGRAVDPKHPQEGSIWIYADISELKRAEADLRISASAFESQEGMLITDANCLILRVNRAFTEITGYSAEEAVGQTPNILSSGRHDADFYTGLWSTIERTGAWQGEIWDRRKNGEEYPLWLAITAVRNSEGEITNYVGSHFDITERKRADERIKELAFYDPLTGLPNRRLLLDRLQHVLVSRLRSERFCALLFVDLDNFKTLNDTLGHDFGDELLKQVAQRMVRCVREGDTVARLGGDEFVVMLDDLSNNAEEAANQAEIVGEKIILTLNENYLLFGGTEYRSTPSIGVTLFVGNDCSLDELLKRADLAMYQAKAAGRNTLRFFDPEMQTIVLRRAALEADLSEALEKGQFVLYYQAQVIGTGPPIGAEALLRWHHPERGMVSPGDFIPLAEETGHILPLGHWVLLTACTQLASWAHQPDMAHLTIAVNVSVRQFRQPTFVEEVLAVLSDTGADPCRLKLELTESMLVTDVEDVIAKMSALKALGVGFSLDDFGTGYSSLSYLKRLPLDQLKIDQSFVREILTDTNDAAIAKMVIALAESMGLSVIAEGVEMDVQRDFLARHGCHAYQGYLFSRPLPLTDFESLTSPVCLNRKSEKDDSIN